LRAYTYLIASYTTLWTGRYFMSNQSEDIGGPAGPTILIYSLHAGNAIAVADLQRMLAATGITVGESLPVQELFDHQPQGRAWAQAGFRAVIAAGGDGTIGTVATHLQGSGLPMGIIPMGTANDVARSLYLPLDLEEACRTIRRGRPVPVDAGEAVPALMKPGALAVEPEIRARAQSSHASDAPRPEAGAYFLHALTLGLNVEFARLATDVARRERLGGLNYPSSMLEALTRYKPIPVTMHLTGTDANDPQGETVVTCEAVQVMAVNTPVFGGTVHLRMPDVHLQDQLLDFIVLEAPEPSHVLATVQGLVEALARLADGVQAMLGGEPDKAQAQQQTGGPLDFLLPGVHRYKASAAVIETLEPVDITMDGEIRTHTPALVRSAREPLHVLLDETALRLLHKDEAVGPST
jgi:diacylglycerol kinase (ATP)